MNKKLISIFIAIIVIIFIIACAEKKESVTVAAHPDGWSTPGSENFHGKIISESNGKLQNCTGCHAENRFANFHGTEEEMLMLIEQMQLLAGTSFDPGDVEKVHASLNLLKCSQCHLGGGEIKRLALRTEEEQREIIREMLLKAEESVERQEIDATQEAYHEIYGF